MSTNATACTVVAKGGVGESGASSLVTHVVNGPTPKIMVLRVESTNLCPNTGAVAIIVADGVPVAFGPFSAQHSLIQVEAPPGTHVAAIVHTVPLFNGIVCVRLGELNYTLSECELVTAVKAASHVIGAMQINTRDWYAWNNLMPPRPDDFHIVGEVQVPNPGFEVLLVPRSPQGINPRILLLDLILTQKPGIWPQHVAWMQARYDKVNITYDNVEIYYHGQLIASVPVVNVQ